MSSPFSITCASENLKLERNAGETTFTVTNVTDRTVQCRVDLEVDPPAKSEWFNIEHNQRSIPSQGVEQVTVNLKAPIDAEGKNSFRIVAVSLARPDEDFTPGPSVAFTLAKQAAPPPPPPFKWWLIPIFAVIVLAIATAIYFITRDKGMPDFTGKPVSEVEKTIASKGFIIKGRSFQRSGDPEGTVIAQTPAKGAPVPADKSVELVISGTGFITVPDVKGRTFAQARAALIAVGLEAVAGNTANTAGVVLSQNPRPGIKVVAGSRVMLSLQP